MKDYKNEYPINTFTGETRKELEELIDRVKKETAEYVCNKMTNKNSEEEEKSLNEALDSLGFTESERRDLVKETVLFGYERKERQIENIKQQIIKEL